MALGPLVLSAWACWLGLGTCSTAIVGINNLKYGNMKKIILLFAWASILSGVSAQEPLAPKLVDRAYRVEYRREIKTAEAQVEAAKQAGYDIILDVMERVPTSVGIEAIDHWGEGVLFPEALKERIVRECVNPVVVKISDTGVDVKHPELAGNWWLPSSDYTGDVPTFHLHGTHVAGITFSLLEPMIRGGKVQMKDCRVLNSQGNGNFSWAANMLATERAEDVAFTAKGTPVIYNFSWGGMVAPISTLEEQMKASAEKGVMFCVAAGNSGAEVPSYPASSAYAIATASLDKSLTVSSYSTRGIFVDNAMPGRDINSTVPGGGFAVLSGTSMASPMMTAAAAVALSKWGKKLPDVATLHTYFSKIAIDIIPEGYDKAAGWGIAYFYAILDNDPDKVIGPPPPPPPPVVLKKYTSEWGFFEMRWRMNSETTWKYLRIPEIRITVNGKIPTEGSYDQFSAWIPTYFRNRGMILSDGMNIIDAMYWTGRFLVIVAGQQGYEITVNEMTATDEKGRAFIFDNFTGSLEDLVRSYPGKQSPALVEVETTPRE